MLINYWRKIASNEIVTNQGDNHEHGLQWKWKLQTVAYGEIEIKSMNSDGIV